MPIERNQVYECEVCGNIVEVLRAGGGDLVCCGKPMALLEGNTTDAAQEKHVPVIEKIDGGYSVKVGEVPHPMAAEHFIEWIEIEADGMVLRRYLAPGDAPEATFAVAADSVTAREHCNLHGLWRKG